MHHLLMQALLHHRQQGYTPAREIEACFGSCYHYWSLVAEKAMNYTFSPDEEINFFRNLKPLFTTPIEYYQLLYHSLLFQPESPSSLRLLFWQREAGRLSLFISRHAFFYEYYTKGYTYHEKEFFTRRFDELYPAEPRSSCDHLVSRLTALQQYHDYATMRLEEISGV